MMEAIIVFFRDVLNGPLYVVVFIVCLILILVCISEIRKNILEVKEKKEKLAASRVVLLDPSGSGNKIEVNLHDISSNVVKPDVAVPTAMDAVVPNMGNFAEVSVPTGLDAVVPSGMEVVEEPVNDVVESAPAVSEPKKVVMIDPAMVAAASSTVNVVGLTSEQQASVSENNLSTEIVENSQSSNVGTEGPTT